MTRLRANMLVLDYLSRGSMIPHSEDELLPGRITYHFTLVYHSLTNNVNDLPCLYFV